MSLTDEVRRTIRHELREQFGYALDDGYWLPPADLDAEGEILSARLNGHVLAEQLEPLRTHHFYSVLNQHTWIAAGEVAPGDVDGVYRALVTRGYMGSVAHEVFVLAEAQPFCLLPQLREHAQTLIRLWSQREVIRLLQRVGADVRRGAIDVYGARAELEKRMKEILG